MQTNKTLMEMYGQFGFQPDREGFIKMFNGKCYREVSFDIFTGNTVLLKDCRKNVIAERKEYIGNDCLVMDYIETFDRRPNLLTIPVNEIQECVGIQRGQNCVEYNFTYNNLVCKILFKSYPDKFEPKTLKDEVGQAIASISTQDLLKSLGGFGYEEMKPQEFYDVFTVEGTHIPVVDIWVAKYCKSESGFIRQDSTLLKNRIKNVFFRHEINADGTENIIVQRGKVKGKGGYDSDFIVVVSCDKVSGCVCSEQSYSVCQEKQLSANEKNRVIQFAFDDVVCLLEYKLEVK